MPLRDYEDWLTRYDDPGSPLSWRLAVVQEWLRADLDQRCGLVSVVSACAGDGRDLIDVLAHRSDADRVTATLLEAHPRVAERARSRAGAAGLSRVAVRTCDAAETSNYAGVVPADIVVLVGMLGNMSHADVWTTIAAAPHLCAPGATLIWSRGRDRDDINDAVRAAFTDVGFVELDHRASDQPTLPAVGLLRYDGPPVALVTARRLFSFWR